MKPQYAKMKTLTLLIISSAIMLIATSFQDSPKPAASAPSKIPVDTPKKKSVHIEIDMKDLDKAMEEINIKLKEIDWDKISKEITASLNSIDMEKINKEVAASIRNIDWDKIKTEVNNSIKDIDLDKIEIDIRKATDEIKANMNSEEFKNNMQKLQKIDKEKLEKELRKSQKELEKSKDDIKLQIEKAGKEINSETSRPGGIEETTYNFENAAFPEKHRLFILI